MRVILQRTSEGAVSRAVGEAATAVAAGVCILVGIDAGDAKPDIEYIARKTLSLRVFEDPASGKMWAKNVTDVKGEVLVAAQPSATVAEDGSVSLVPGSFSDEAKAAYEELLVQLKKGYAADKIVAAPFGEPQHVNFVNSGPITLTLDSRNKN